MKKTTTNAMYSIYWCSVVHSSSFYASYTKQFSDASQSKLMRVYDFQNLFKIVPTIEFIEQFFIATIMSNSLGTDTS